PGARSRRARASATMRGPPANADPRERTRAPRRSRARRTPMTDPVPSPSPADKARIEAVVAECIEALERGEVDPATRLCAEDHELLTRAQRRLGHLAARGLIPDSDMLPARIGPYRVLRELGSGGMGSVYLADQV